MIVYTASIGRRMAPQQRWPGLRMVCFSNQQPAAPWEWVRIDPGPDIIRQVRRIKLLPWEYIGDFDECLWLDANFRLTRLPDIEADMAVHRHRDRGCLYEEARVCAEWGKDDAETLQQQAQRYAQAGHPEHWGLWETGVMYRRNTPDVRALCEGWWRELQRASYRDQVSLPFVAAQQSFAIQSLGDNVWKSRWARRYPKK